MTPVLPKVITDCLGILQGLQSGAQAATSPKKRLARLWGMISLALDGDFQAAIPQVTWMPAHGAAYAITQARDSQGRCITGVMWRTNRPVDVLA